MPIVKELISLLEIANPFSKFVLERDGSKAGQDWISVYNSDTSSINLPEGGEWVDANCSTLLYHGFRIKIVPMPEKALTS